MSKVKTKRTAGKTRYQNDGYLFAFPIVFMLAALIIYPMAYDFCISFFNINLVTKWKFADFKYYIEASTDPPFCKSALLTFRFMAFVVIGHFVLGFILAALLNREFRGRTVFGVTFILPWFFPEAIMALLFTWIMNPMYGILNGMLKSLGIISASIFWLGSKELAFPSVMFTCIWKGFPPATTTILAGLQNIFKDLYEVTVIDGTDKWDGFHCITLPSLRPILTTVIILDSTWWFRQYTQAFIVTAGGPGTATNLINLNIYGAAFDDLKFGKGAAWGILAFIICYLINSVYRVVLKNG